MFIFLLSLSSLLVAGSAAFFSVLGIASLFSGCYYQVMVMAGALEFAKLIATSFLYRYWSKTNIFLRTYLLIAVGILMLITSAGIFGYLSSAYQKNASKNILEDNKIALIESQKTSVNEEIQQIQNRVNTLNEARKAQEARLPSMSSKNARMVYDEIKQSNEEIKNLTTRLQTLQTTKFEKDSDIITLKTDTSKANDIGTFKFVAASFNTPLDNVVKYFILVLVSVFDPLSVCLVLALNIALTGKITKEETTQEVEVLPIQETPIEESKKKTFGGFVVNGRLKQK
jgi:polyhydroxyalkanoate synthesis regulator phasin